MIRNGFATSGPPSLRTVHPELSSPLIKSEATKSALKEAFGNKSKQKRMQGMDKHLPSSDWLTDGLQLGSTCNW